ncbi:MAG: cation diffusion facilitator family transporter [Candidatus ainarchaeum sp.]|nr:cation diffusion facilitator family transporter [Candidatus ainarchaeum sp.]
MINYLNKEKVAIVAIIANIILAIFKIIIGTLSKSSSVFASGVDSTTDIISSGLSFWGIWISKKPADKEHPYGHHKFEVISGLIITIILFSAGALIIYEAYFNFINPQITNVNYIALGVMIFSALVNEIMARAKIYFGEKEQSIALISDGIHSRTDVISSIAIFFGLLLNPYFIYSESIITFFIGLYIIKQAIRLCKEAIDSLLDSSASEEIEEKIKLIVKENKVKLSELKTQKKGSIITANLEIELPHNLNLKKATTLSKILKEELTTKIESLEYVVIQLKSHDSIESYFSPKDLISKITLKEGFEWQRQGHSKKQNLNTLGKGPKGNCVCPKCGYEIIHKRGLPCSKIKCPNCKINLTRRN